MADNAQNTYSTDGPAGKPQSNGGPRPYPTPRIVDNGYVSIRNGHRSFFDALRNIFRGKTETVETSGIAQGTSEN